MTQKTNKTGMRWIAFSADLSRYLSFFAAWDCGCSVGSKWSESVIVGLGFGDDNKDGDIWFEKNSSETRVELDDRYIISSSDYITYYSKKKRRTRIERIQRFSASFGRLLTFHLFYLAIRVGMDSIYYYYYYFFSVKSFSN